MSDFQHHQLNNSKNVIFAYAGDIEDGSFESLLSIAEQKLAASELRSKTRKKVFSILVEIFQNVQNHHKSLNSKEKSDYEVRLSLSRKDDEYQIISGNYIKTSMVRQLKSRIDDINSLSREEITQRYRDRLDTGKMSKSGGAGLGMLYIVRKSGKKISYKFENINDTLSFFQLTVNVS